ncbi:MAG: ABC transporter permease [Armatimonadaceae bacterium]
MNPNLLHQLYNLSPVALIGVAVLIFLRARQTPLWGEAFRRLARNPSARAAMAVIALYATIGIADSIGWYDSATQERRTVIDAIFERKPERTYSAPLAEMTTGEAKPQKIREKHILGTDSIGADVFYRTLKGVRTAFQIGGMTVLIVTPLALLLGLTAGYYGKWRDDVITYIYTVLSSVPGILLQIAMVLVLGKGIIQICLALGITRWVGLCRMVRGETIKHREREYVRSAKALGVTDMVILVRHILPNLLPVVIISTTLGFSNLVLSEAILSYLGVGVPDNVGSWGNMIDAARDELARDPVIWWNLAAATGAITGLALSLNLFGDAFRDAVDPRLRS